LVSFRSGGRGLLAFFYGLFYNFVKQISLSELTRLKVTTHGDWPIGCGGKRSHLPLRKGEGRILTKLPPSEVGGGFCFRISRHLLSTCVLPRRYSGERERYLKMGGRSASPFPFFLLSRAQRAARSLRGEVISSFRSLRGEVISSLAFGLPHRHHCRHVQLHLYSERGAGGVVLEAASKTITGKNFPEHRDGPPAREVRFFAACSIALSFCQTNIALLNL
jgi:hypothetical protein